MAIDIKAFDESWALMEKAVIPSTVNPVAGFARATLARPEEAPEEWGPRYSIMNERRPLPHKTAEHMVSRGLGTPKQERHAHPTSFMPPEALQAFEQKMNPQPHEWQDLTARPRSTRKFDLGRERIRIPGTSGRFPLPLSEVGTFSDATGTDPRVVAGMVGSGRAPMVDMSSAPFEFSQKVPFFGEREWPEAKGRQGLGWKPREGSGGQLSWHPASGSSGSLMTELSERKAAEDPPVDIGYEGEPIQRGSPQVEDISIDPALRRQGMGTDLTDTYRYIMGLYGFGQEDLNRTPLETIDSRRFWDGYFNARWGPEATHVPQDADDVWFEDVGDPMANRGLEPGAELPGHTGAISTDEEGKMHMAPGGQNFPDPGTPSPLPMLPESNQFVQALKRPEELLAGMPQEKKEVERLTPVERTNRWLARQVAGEIEPVEQVVPGVNIRDIVGEYPFIDWEA